jgi:hypothetical protein
MTAATNPTSVAFTTANGGTAQTFTTLNTAFWRVCTVYNGTSQEAYILLASGTATTSNYTFSVLPGASAAFYAQQPLPNANLNASSQGSYDNDTGAPGLSGQTVFPLDQASMTNWTAQSVTATAESLGGLSVILAGNPTANSNVNVGFQ